MRIYLTKYNLIKLQDLKIKSKISPILTDTTMPLDCACVIHGTAYDWSYVDKLYSMLCRNLSRPVKLHVYTEASRPVPAPYIKHELDDWGISGPKRAWWYKMQLFNTVHHAGPLLYMDLDVVITGNIDWIWQGNTHYFWAVKDFKYLWRPTHVGINSSVMWWDTQRFQYVWHTFCKNDRRTMFLKYHGDQDFITNTVDQQAQRLLNQEQVKSWRWQCFDGGYDFKKKQWKTPNSGTGIDSKTSVLVFHGNPKPHEVQDPTIDQHWY